MGWTESSEWGSKESLVQYLTSPSYLGDSLKLIASAVRGQTLWEVVECVRDTQYHREGHRVILCFLMRANSGSWAYKDMDESMGPYDASCPLKFFDMVPDPGADATAFRARTRAAVAAKAAKRGVIREIKTGDVLVLKPGCKPERVRILSTKPLMGEADGRMYRIVSRHVDHVEEQP